MLAVANEDDRTNEPALFRNARRVCPSVSIRGFHCKSDSICGWAGSLPVSSVLILSICFIQEQTLEDLEISPDHLAALVDTGRRTQRIGRRGENVIHQLLH